YFLLVPCMIAWWDKAAQSRTVRVVSTFPRELTRRGIFSDYRQLAYKGRPRVLSTARFWRPLWRALRFFISAYKFLLSVTPTPLVSTSCAPHSPGRILVTLIRAQRAAWRKSPLVANCAHTST